MLVKDVMVRDVKTIEKGSSVRDAAKMMTDFRVGSLIVTDDKKRMIGIVTESDVLRVVAEGKSVDEKVDSVMTKKVFYVKPEDDIEDAVEIMVKNKIKKLPVITQGALVGIITATDITAAQPAFLEQIGHMLVFGQKQKFVAG